MELATLYAHIELDLADPDPGCACLLEDENGDDKATEKIKGTRKKRHKKDIEF